MNKFNTETLRVLSILESIKNRPSIHFGPDTDRYFDCFLEFVYGLEMGISILSNTDRRNFIDLLVQAARTGNKIPNSKDLSFSDAVQVIIDSIIENPIVGFEERIMNQALE